MALKIKPILFKLDFIGFIPQFRILDEFRYKSVFSSILSIIIILFSIFFVLYSLIDFIHQQPKVEYYKNNDYETNKTFLISDSLLIFQHFFMCPSDQSKLPIINIYLTSPLEEKYDYLEFETCELGKNINLKFKDLIDTFNSIEQWKLEEYLCINYKSTNFTLYSHPLLPYEKENYLVIQIESDCKDFLLDFKIITENDFIDHNKKDNPIIPYYQINKYHLDEERKFITYNYQYIKYESDDGFIFSNKKIINGIGEDGLNEFDGANDASNSIFFVQFKMNRANYDYYRRSFLKFQTFLAEVMSLINLLITISRIITEFLLYKKMNKDIIRYIITSSPIKDNDIKKNIISNDKKIQNIFDITSGTKSEDLEKKDVENKIIESKKINVSLVFDKTNNKKKIENEDIKIINIMKDLKIYYIIKSIFCCNNKKMQLIELCNDYVKKKICIERMLKRLYILETIFNIIIEIDKDLYIQNDIPKIKKIIDSIYNE